MIKDLLTSIGLTKSEVSVYIALLELGETTTGKIVDKSGVASSKIYELLEKLATKGLVSSIIKDNTKHFSAAQPSRILDYLQEQEQKIAEQTIKIKQILPQLQLKADLAQKTSEATIYRGLKGIETAFMTALKSVPDKGEVMVMNIPPRTEAENIVFRKISAEESRRKIRTRLIFNKNAAAQADFLLGGLAHKEIKVLDIDAPASINILGDTVIILPASHGENLVISIKNKDVAQSFRAQFESVWEDNTSITRGFDALEKILHDINIQAGENGEFKVLNAAFGTKGRRIEFEKFFESVNNERVEHKVAVKMLLQADVRPTMKRMKKVYDKYSEYKYLTTEHTSPVEIVPFKDRTHIIVQDEGPTIITIHNQAVTKAFEQQFDELWNQRAYTFTGESGVRHVFDLMLEHKDIWFIGGNFGIKQYFPKYWNAYKKKRLDAKSTWHDLIDAGADVVENLKKEKYYESRVLSEQFKSPHVLAIFADYVVNIHWAGKDTVIFLFQDSGVAKSYRNYFDYLWARAV